MADGYELDAASISELRRVLAWWRAQPKGSDGGLPDARGGLLPMPWHFCRLDGVLSADSSQIASIYTWSGSAWVDSTENLTVYAPPLLSSGSVESGKWILVMYHLQSERWYAIAAEGPC